MLRSGVAHFFFLFFFWVLWAPYRRWESERDVIYDLPSVTVNVADASRVVCDWSSGCRPESPACPSTTCCRNVPGIVAPPLPTVKVFSDHSQAVSKVLTEIDCQNLQTSVLARGPHSHNDHQSRPQVKGKTAPLQSGFSKPRRSGTKLRRCSPGVVRTLCVCVWP